MLYYNLELVGKRIKELRKEKNKSQSTMAEELGIHTKTISKAERGVAGLSVDNLLLLSDYFGVSLDYIIKGNEGRNDDLSKLINHLSKEKRMKAYMILKKGELLKKVIDNAFASTYTILVCTRMHIFWDARVLYA